MHCPGCGKQREPGAFRCASCHRIATAFWINLFALLVLLCAVAINLYDSELFLNAFDRDLLVMQGSIPPGLHLPVHFPPPSSWSANSFAIYFGIIVLLAVVLAIFVRRRQGWFARFVKSGAALSCVAAVVLLFTMLLTSPDLYPPMAGHEAMVGLNFINLFQKDYRARDSKGYDCNLDDITYPAAGRVFWYQKGSRLGYSYTITGCDESNRQRYRIAAVPEHANGVAVAFCTNESGVVRWGSYSLGDPKTLEKVLAACQ